MADEERAGKDGQAVVQQQRRVAFTRVSQLIWLVVAAVEVLLLVRIFFKMVGGGASAGSIYNVTEPLAAPFRYIVQSPTWSGTEMDIPAYIALVVYPLAVLIVLAVARAIFRIKPAS